MAIWKEEVDRLIGQPPGVEEGFSDEEIARNGRVDFHRLSTWAIVCEEMLDTTRPRVYFERAKEELQRRAIPSEIYLEMRRLAWLTVGWLNYEKMLWEWNSLDEKDILRAIEWQFVEGWIDQAERDHWIAFANRFIDSSDPSDAFERKDT